MTTYADFVSSPGTTERDAATELDNCCTSEAGEWFCTRTRGHKMPHQAGAGFDGSDVYAEWSDAR